jgi:phosphoribosylformylglycinamidine synthase
MALDYNGKEGVATSIGHAPISGLIDPVAGSRNAITEALTNIIWAPLKEGLHSVSLSANWMWPCKNEGEDARLYEAVKAISEFSIDLGINVPTGKDSLSMKQKYPDGDVISPGTVIISATANCNDITKVIEPVFQKNAGDIYYINVSEDEFKLGGSSFAQINNKIGSDTPTIKSAGYVKTVFNTIQQLIKDAQIVAGHDVASGGLITTLLELCFADNNLGAELDITALNQKDSFKILFAENAGIVFQAKDTSIEAILSEAEIDFLNIGKVTESDTLSIINNAEVFTMTVSKLRDMWYKTSLLLDRKQTANGLADTRFGNYRNQPLTFKFPKHFTGKLEDVIANAVKQSVKNEKIATSLPIAIGTPRNDKPKAAIIREKGSNSEREMANAMYLAGFDVKDVHMTDLISGRET